jgi:hypothetical protein
MSSISTLISDKLPSRSIMAGRVNSLFYYDPRSISTFLRSS